MAYIDWLGSPKEGTFTSFSNYNLFNSERVTQFEKESDTAQDLLSLHLNYIIIIVHSSFSGSHWAKHNFWHLGDNQ